MGGIDEAQHHDGGLAGPDGKRIMRGGLGAAVFGIYGGAVAVDDAFADAVFHVRRAAGRAPEPLGIGVVAGEEDLRWGVGVEPAAAVIEIREFDAAGYLVEFGLGRAVLPRPGVAYPDGGQYIERGGFGAAIADLDADEDVVGRSLGVFHEDVEIAVVGEDAGIEQFILGIVAGAAAILLDQIVVRKRGLRILVQALHVGVGGSAVEVRLEEHTSELQ